MIDYHPLIHIECRLSFEHFLFLPNHAIYYNCILLGQDTKGD